MAGFLIIRNPMKIKNSEQVDRLFGINNCINIILAWKQNYENIIFIVQIFLLIEILPPPHYK